MLNMSFLNKKIISFSDDVIGLDIGTTSVKAIQLENRMIKNYGFRNIPDNVIVNGKIIDEKRLSEIVNIVVSEAKPSRMKTKKVVCSISESKSFLRLISVPTMNQDELSEAVKWEIEANIPLSVDQVYYDWKVITDIFPEDDGKVHVLVLAAAKKVVNQILNIVDNAGLEVIGIESASTALVRALSDNENKKTVLIIELGKNKTTFVFVIKNVPCFTSSVPVSEQMIVSQIAKKFNISNEKARKLEEQNGINSFFEDKYLFSAIEPALKNLVSEIEKTIDFYLEGLKYSKLIDEIIVCGKLSKEKNIIMYLSKKLKREIKVGNILAGLSPDKKMLPIVKREIAMQYATAIGLTLDYDE